MPHQILFREQYGADGYEVVYIKPPDQKVVVPLDSIYSQSMAYSIIGSVRNFFQIVFLPQGYPQSVSGDYFSYQLWDTVQAFCSALNGTLTTQAIMKGVGVGDQASTPLAAAITWILKDGAGNIGRIVFAWWKGTSLDADCKKWRLFADVLNDLAMFLELLLPFFMGYSTALFCVATIFKSIVGVAGGATRAALTQHQAIRDNMADVSAKDGSQETCVNLLASLAGIVLLTAVQDHRLLWLMFFFFTFTHIYANFKAVKSLTISTLNTARLNIVISNYIQTGSVLNPNIVNQKEAVILGQGITAKEICGHKIVIGESVASVVRESALTADQFKVLHHLHQDRVYMLVPSLKQRKIFILLQQGVCANSNEIVKAYFHGILLGLAANMSSDKAGARVSRVPQQSSNFVLKELEQALKSALSPIQSGSDLQSPEHIPLMSSQLSSIIASIQVDSVRKDHFMNSLQSAGWATMGHHLGSNEWRFIWPHSSKGNA